MKVSLLYIRFFDKSSKKQEKIKKQTVEIFPQNMI